MTEPANTAEAVDDDARPEEGQEPEAVEAPPPQEEVDSPPENTQEDNIDYESFAKVQGWSPKEKWKGADDQWVDAKEFVERGRQFQSTLKEKNQTLERRLQEQEDANKRAVKMFDKLNENAKKDALDKIRTQQKQALEEDNDTLYNELESKKTELHEEFKVEAPNTQPQPDPNVEAFRRENSWYGADPIMTDYANRYCNQMAAEGKTVAQQLEETKRYIVGHFPDKFENPKREAAPTVSTASAPSKVNKATGWKDIPAADKKIAEGIMKSTGLTKEQYVKEYFELENLK